MDVLRDGPAETSVSSSLNPSRSLRPTLFLSRVTQNWRFRRYAEPERHGAGQVSGSAIEELLRLRLQFQPGVLVRLVACDRWTVSLVSG